MGIHTPDQNPDYAPDANESTKEKRDNAKQWWKEFANLIRDKDQPDWHGNVYRSEKGMDAKTLNLFSKIDARVGRMKDYQLNTLNASLVALNSGLKEDKYSHGEIDDELRLVDSLTS